MIPKLAIIIPYYKIDFFEETIKSIVNQTNKSFVLYIGNDASSDDPLPILKKYLSLNKFHYYNYQENLGGNNLAMQWERILENVSEEWFQILGDDDRISDNFVESFYENYNDINLFNVVKARSIIVKEYDLLKFDFTNLYKSGVYNSIDFFFDKLKGKVNSSLSEHIFRKKTFKNFRKYPLAWHTDDFTILEMSYCQQLYYIAESKVIIREYNGSISGKNDNLILKRKASYLFYLDVLKLFYKNKVSKKNKDIFLKEFFKRYPKEYKSIVYRTLYGRVLGAFKLCDFYLVRIYNKYKI